MRSEAWHEINNAEAPLNSPDCGECEHLVEKFYEVDGTWGHYCEFKKEPMQPWGFCYNHTMIVDGEVS